MTLKKENKGKDTWMTFELEDQKLHDAVASLL